MRPRRALVTLLVAGLTAAAAVPALAHTELVSTGPKNGVVVKHLPKTIVLNLTEAPHSADSGTVTLNGTDHAVKTRLNAKNARQVRITTKSDQVGKYTVKVKVTADDGHHEVFTWSFRVTR